MQLAVFLIFFTKIKSKQRGYHGLKGVTRLT